MRVNELNPRLLLLLLGAIGLITVPHIGHIPLPLSVIFFALLFWRLLGVWRPGYLPNGKVISLLTLSCIGLLYSQHTGVWGRDAGTAVFVTALGLKLLELNKKRDVYLLSYLAFIVAASQFLYQQNIVIAAYSLLVCCVLLTALVAINSAQQQNTIALRSATTIVLQALPLTIIIFVLFPRIQAPAWELIDNNKNQAQFGLSETLEPGSINKLALSPQLAFRVKFDGELPPQNQLYWRGPVFSYTDGKVWRVKQHDYVVFYQDKLKFSGKAYQYTLLLEPQDHNWVYALDMPVRFDASVQRNSNYQLTSRTRPGEAAEFSLMSYPQYNTGYITKTEFHENLQLPGRPSKRIADLVTHLHGFEDKPELFIQQILNYFRTQHFSYSLQPPLMENSPIETFLFEARSGFCNHYATAFVYLMRVAGIPARVVSGYQGGEFNAVGQFLEIRQANAHAWAEVWLKGKGWIRVDPTTAIAPDRVEQDVNIKRQVETGMVSLTPTNMHQWGDQFGLKQAEQLWHSLDYHWQRWIIGFGGENQSLLLSTIGIGSLVEAVFWVLASIGLVLLILAAWLLKPRCKPEDPSLKLYRQFCRKMAKAGVVIRLGEGANDFAIRAKTQRPEIGDFIDEITQLFIRLRYQRFPSESDLKLLKKRIIGL
ncbi:MAG: transglutaminase TgpA family protein [Gammaproteobacteria bacterium]